MSKIEEMGEKYGRAHPFTWTDADGILNEDIYSPDIAFEEGAYTVLKEIENILSLGYNTIATVDLIVEKVKELKGE